MPVSAFSASDITCWAATFRVDAVMAAARTCRSLYCSARLAEATPTRAISGTATTIIPLARTDWSSHHRPSRPDRTAAADDERMPPVLTDPPGTVNLTTLSNHCPAL